MMILDRIGPGQVFLPPLFTVLKGKSQGEHFASPVLDKRNQDVLMESKHLTRSTEG